MAKTRAIVKRRKAIRNIRKITRTMELIATARYKKAMERAQQAEAFTKKIAELVSDLSHTEAAATHPLLESRDQVDRSILLVLTSNRGLCGGYNGNVLRAASHFYSEESIKHPIELEISGKRGIAFMKYQKYPMDKSFTHFEDKPTFEEVEVLANRYLELFLSKKIDALDVTYTKFVSMARQKAVTERLLPLGSLTEEEGEYEKLEKRFIKEKKVDYEFMPSAGDILNEIVPVSFKIRLFKCFLDAAVSEQIARMVAMKGATENASHLIKSLTMRYNRARQAQITTELTEIIGTAEALK